MHAADVRRIRIESDPSVIVGWLAIAVIVAGGFAALAYALGKYAGMGVCK